MAMPPLATECTWLSLHEEEPSLPPPTHPSTLARGLPGQTTNSIAKPQPAPRAPPGEGVVGKSEWHWCPRPGGKDRQMKEAPVQKSPRGDNLLSDQRDKLGGKHSPWPRGAQWELLWVGEGNIDPPHTSLPPLPIFIFS